MTKLWQLSGSEIATAIRAKEFTATEVCKDHLQRLSEVNGALNAVVKEMPDEALEAAKKVDEQIA